MYARLVDEAEARRLTHSRLLREILKAHQASTRLEAPHPRSSQAAALRELCRIGNNLNQIALQANLMRLHHIEDKAAVTLDALLATVRRM